MGAMMMATDQYLGLASTVTFVQKCISRLINMRVNSNSRNKRRTFSCPNDIQTLIESTINPAILNTIQQQALETTCDIASESLWFQTTAHDVIPTEKLKNSKTIQDFPIGHLVLLFNILNGGQGTGAFRRHRFQPLMPGDIPNGRWRSAMAYMLVADIGDQGDGTESYPPAAAWRMPDVEGCITLGVSIFVKRESETERNEPIVEGTTISVPVPESCATWAVVESYGCFDVADGDQIMFEVWWDAVKVSENITQRSTLYFGGIRCALSVTTLRGETDKSRLTAIDD
jgi:hypothetical protein